MRTAQAKHGAAHAESSERVSGTCAMRLWRCLAMRTTERDAWIAEGACAMLDHHACALHPRGQQNISRTMRRLTIIIADELKANRQRVADVQEAWKRDDERRNRLFHCAVNG